jgi:superfamily II DNA or RNA helicase
MSADRVDRVDIASEFLETLSFTPYPVQEEAIYAWFSSDQGVWSAPRPVPAKP